MNKSASFISTQVSSGDYYYLNLTPDKKLKETVVCGGREQCAPDYRIERHGFKFYSLEFVSAGKGTLELRGKSYPLGPGALFFYGPGISHKIRTDPAAPLLKHFVDFTGSDLFGLIKKTALVHTPLYTTSLLRIRSLFESLLKTGGTESRHRNELCVLILKQLILCIDETALPQQEAFSQAWQTYFRCRQSIEENFSTLGKVEQAARDCHLDKAYLCRLFQRYANETPLQLLTRLKMGRAAEMLSGQNLLIKQVAEEAGYPDPYHFSRVFKRVYGIHPEAFIQTVRRKG
jgi:AraC-like DNA-binding protein/quercetin dioxygenase-like cupin family protein